MIRRFFAPLGVALGLLYSSVGQDFGWTGTNSLAIPAVGDHQLRIIDPNLLELTLITTRTNDQSFPAGWDFVGDNFTLKLPSPAEFKVISDGKPVAVQKIGFKRRPLYAPLKRRDLRIGNWLYLELGGRLGQVVEVQNPSGKLWTAGNRFRATNSPVRFSPALHVNQVGYQPEFPKKAMVGYYLGSLGELRIPAGTKFNLVEEATGKSVFSGALKQRPDRGFTYMPTPYQEVFEADFSSFEKPGKYRLAVEGLGASFPFQIHDGTMAAFARTYALGLYHQRCGTNNIYPFTRHTHEACHIAPAEIPTKNLKEAQKVIAEVSSDAKKDPRHKAPPLADSDASLYPFVTQGKIDVSGGHHDAGDYSKYTINSAGLLHYLIFATDHLKGAGELDNLGLPESGDGKSDLLQEGKWEADFLAKMQDKDGGFYFLVYPKTRRYEDNVLPDKGDPQIVWPKNTTATAAAVAALAEAGSSPAMKKHYPKEAERYLTSALRGWAFLERALAKHGKDGAYQKLTHYGHEFWHDDEIAWAAAALFSATGKKEFESKFKEHFDPENNSSRRWGWWPMFEGYGNAARTYVFGVKSGRVPQASAEASLLTKCETLIHETAGNHVRFARETAYGTSFPDPNKGNKNAGWYFSSERAFDITVAYQLRPEPGYLEAVISNLNFEAGSNPINVSYVSGVGWRRQREIVHQYAQNDQRVLPPTGLPVGNIQAGFAWLHHYQKELGALPYPPDGATEAPYPFYDRWGDTFNTTTEFVVMDQGRSLASLAFWMAQTPVGKQSWKPIRAQVTGVPKSAPADKPLTAKLEVAGLDVSQAQITWEAAAHEPQIGREFTFRPESVGNGWVEAEAVWPDGRRVFAVTNFSASAALSTPPNTFFNEPLASNPTVRVLYHLDGDLNDATGKAPALELSGQAALDSGNVGWMKRRAGAALAFKDLGDKATVSIPASQVAAGGGIALQALIYVNSLKAFNRTNVKILSLTEEWDASLEMIENMYEGPMVKGGTKFSVTKADLVKALPTGQWHHLEMSVDKTGYRLKVNGKEIAQAAAPERANWGKRPVVKLEFGNFEGWIDEVAILSTP